MIRQLSFVARWGSVLLLLLGARAQAQANNGGGRSAAFSRAKRELGSAGRETQTLSSLAADAQEALAAVTSAASGDAAMPLQQAMVDVWLTNPALKMARRLINGEGMGTFIPDMLGGKEMLQVFSNPIAAHTVINRFPMFQAFKGVKELAAKNVEDFTESDGLQVLDSFREFAKRGVKAMAMVANPEQYVDFMGKYADLAGDEVAPANARHRKMKELVGALQAGDQAAAREFHDMVAGDIWGDALDLKEFGSDGTEPQTLKQLRELAMSDSDMWDLITGSDPIAKEVLANPTVLFNMGAYDTASV